MRTTNDKKDYNLRIRLNDRMYGHLERMSGKRGCSYSEYIRELIDKDIREQAKYFSEKNQKIPYGGIL